MYKAQKFHINFIIINQFVALVEIFKFVISNWKQDSHSSRIKKDRGVLFLY